MGYAVRRPQKRRFSPRIAEVVLSRDELLMKLGAAKKEARGTWNLVEVMTPGKDQSVTPKTFRFSKCHSSECKNLEMVNPLRIDISDG